MYIKNGASNTAWDAFNTTSVSGTVSAGVAGRLALYPASGNNVDDVYVQNSQNIDILVAAQATRSAAIEYTIPNPGDAITAASFILSEGASQTINGAVIVNGDFTVHGTLTTLDTTNTTITDKLLTLNKGGAAASAGGSGIEFEENAVITGYLKVSAARDAFDMSVPANAFASKLSLVNLTASQTAKLANYSGTFVMRPDGTAGVSSQVAFFNGADSIVSASGFTYVAGVLTSQNMTVSALGLGVAHVSAAGVLSSSAVALASEVSGILPLANGGTNANLTASAGSIVYSTASAHAHSAVGTAGQALISGGAAAPTWFAASGVVHAVSGVLSTSAVVLTSEVSGILPVANGGTNSSTALNNSRIMVSAGGAIVEAAALTNGQLLVGSTGAAPVAANITVGALASLTVTNGAGTIAIDAIQDIRTSASPTFLAQTLSGSGAFWHMSDAADQYISTFTVNTTTATLTTIATVATVSDTVMLVEAKITGRRTGGSAGTAGDSCTYIRTVRVKNVGGVVSLMNLQSDFTSEDQAAFNGTIGFSGTNVLVQVQGAANNNMTWKAVVTKTY